MDVCFRSADDDTIQAVNLLAQGKRNLLVGDMVEAVSQLQEACRLLYVLQQYKTIKLVNTTFMRICCDVVVHIGWIEDFFQII